MADFDPLAGHAVSMPDKPAVILGDRTFTFAQLANVVVGQETGLLNCVAFEKDVRKVVLLSHSTVENLTRDWPNTASLSGDVHCFPCHRLHYNWEHCNQSPVTKAAACQTAISVSSVLKEALPVLGRHEQPESSVIPIRAVAA